METEKTVVLKRKKSDHFAFLVGIVGVDNVAFPGGTFALSKDDLSIGRDGDNDLYLRNKSVSRMHARIQYDENAKTYLIHDLATENGTFVNGEQIQRVALSDNDHIRLGNEVEFIFKQAW